METADDVKRSNTPDAKPEAVSYMYSVTKDRRDDVITLGSTLPKSAGASRRKVHATTFTPEVGCVTYASGKQASASKAARASRVSPPSSASSPSLSSNDVIHSDVTMLRCDSHNKAKPEQNSSCKTALDLSVTTKASDVTPRTATLSTPTTSPRSASKCSTERLSTAAVAVCVETFADENRISSDADKVHMHRNNNSGSTAPVERHSPSERAAGARSACVTPPNPHHDRARAHDGVMTSALRRHSRDSPLPSTTITSFVVKTEVETDSKEFSHSHSNPAFSNEPLNTLQSSLNCNTQQSLAETNRRRSSSCSNRAPTPLDCKLPSIKCERTDTACELTSSRLVNSGTREVRGGPSELLTAVTTLASVSAAGGEAAMQVNGSLLSKGRSKRPASRDATDSPAPPPVVTSSRRKTKVATQKQQQQQKQAASLNLGKKTCFSLVLSYIVVVDSQRLATFRPTYCT